jgi:hypothetical protein
MKENGSFELIFYTIKNRVERITLSTFGLNKQTGASSLNFLPLDLRQA